MALFGLSKRADYGLIMLVLLARRGKGKVVNAAEMVREKCLPKAFVSQIAKKFIEAGILGSREGKGGGYFLRKEPGRLTVKEIVEAVEGRVKPAGCIGGKCGRERGCESKKFMKKLADDMEKVLESYSLLDVMRK